MVRNYVRKTERGQASEETFKAAVADIRNGLSLREAARLHKLCRMTLSRYKTKLDTSGDARSPLYSKHRQVFSPEQEKELERYLQESAERHFGLSLTEARKMAYQCVVKYNITCPPSWHNNKAAGEDWLLGFRKRHKLSLRVAENTSLARAIGFNRPSVDLFYDNLLNVISRNSYGPDSIYNLDETGVTTVPEANRVIARQGTRSVGRIVSSEKGTLVTLVCAINAVGNSVPPMFIFPRKNYRDHFINGAPPGSIGIANGSGWIKEANFLEYLRHFVHHTKPSAERPVLLILDNHVSHLYVPALDYCRENHITMLSIPPHSSHKIQPLDRVIYGPFKTYFNNRSHAWMRENPGKPMTIYHIPSLVGETLPKAMVANNIIESFRCTGIWPVNRDTFTEADFMASQVTERSLAADPRPSTSADPRPSTLADPGPSTSADPSPSTLADPGPSTLADPGQSTSAAPGPSISDAPDPSISAAPGPSISTAPGPSTSAALSPSTLAVPGPSTSIDPCSPLPAALFSPHSIMPIPHSARKSKPETTDRRKRKSAILTDSPVKNLLAMSNQKEPKQPKQTGKGATGKGKCTTTKGKGKGKKTRKASVSDSEEEDTFCLLCIEPYSSSRPGEKWVACAVCGLWAHEDCTDMGSKSFVFVCQNCDSD